MSIDTTKAMNYSWMSQASYLNLTSVVPGNAVSLQDYLQLKGINEGNIFADNQAKIFTDPTTGYSFINQLANTGNGTSLTVFKSNADNSYTIAVRGTEPDAQLGKDLLVDAIGVVAAGKAKVQLLEAFRYYKQITTAAGQAVTYSDAEVNAMAGILLSGTTLTGGLENITAAKNAFAMLTANDKGLGKLIPDGATINFAGHSLGGHVAYLLADLVSLTAGSKHPLGDVMTYNAPGENALIYEWGNWLGLPTTSHSGLIGSKHLAFYGKGGLNVTAGLGQVIGTRVPLFIEKELVDQIANHSIVKLSDSLALYDLYSKLSPALTQSAITGILESASGESLNSLESTLDALRILLIDGDIASDSGKQTPEGNRDTFYKNLYELQKSANYTALQTAIKTGGAALVASSRSTGDQAKTDFGRFLTLNYLLPIVITGADSTLQSIHNSLYTDWKADQDLTPEQKANGEATYSDRWYTERSRMLGYWLDYASTDGRRSVDATLPANRYYQDLGKGVSFTVDRTSNTSPDNTVKPMYVFGTDDTDTLWGKGDHDVLFGGGGMDRIDGAAGNDIIEGLSGDDILYGGSEITLAQAIANGRTDTGSGQRGDWLNGGKGDDTLVGGKDNDVLMGGIGGDILMGQGRGVGRMLLQLSKVSRGGTAMNGAWRLAA